METSGVSYNRLFNTRITNTYYKSGFGNRDFEIKPSSETEQVMRNSNLVFKNDDEGFRVYYKTNGSEADNAPSFVNFADINLVFEMNLLETAIFSNVMNLNCTSPVAKEFNGNNILYFTNKADVTVNALRYRLIDQIKPNIFTFEFPQPAELPEDVGILVIENISGDNVTPSLPNPNSIIPNSSLKFLYPIDFSLLPTGIYKFTSTVMYASAAPDSVVDTFIYINNDLVGKKVYGIIDIKVVGALQANFPAANPSAVPPIAEKRVYDAAFIRRESFWKYIMVLNSSVAPVADMTLNIQYVAPPVTVPPSPYPTSVTFTRAADVTVNNIQAAVFNSNVKLPFFSIPKTNINFRKVVSTVDVVITTNLAGPSAGIVSAAPGNPEISEIYIYI